MFLFYCYKVEIKKELKNHKIGLKKKYIWSGHESKAKSCVMEVYFQ